jgi:hypothetical protein
LILNPAASYSSIERLYSTIGAGGLNGRVRDGIGCDTSAIATGKCSTAINGRLRGTGTPALAEHRMSRAVSFLSVSISQLNTAKNSPFKVQRFLNLLNEYSLTTEYGTAKRRGADW